MAAFDLYFAPTVSASVNASDNELWDASYYDGSLENDWANTGTNARLTQADGSVVPWNTIALGISSRRLDLSSFVASVGGVSLAAHASGWATITAISLAVEGTFSVSSLDLTAGIILAGMREKASGGIFTPAISGEPQFSDGASFNNGGAGVGLYEIINEITSGGSIAGLSSANAIAMFSAATFQTRMLVTNDTSTIFTLNWDRIRIRITGTTGSIPVPSSPPVRGRTGRPIWFSRTGR
jgi:hypothetical protein